MAADVVDVCFVGAGIACLHAARELLLRRPGVRVLLLERDPRRCGGRAWGATAFGGVPISRGAGVARLVDPAAAAAVTTATVVVSSSSTSQAAAADLPTAAAANLPTLCAQLRLPPLGGGGGGPTQSPQPQPPHSQPPHSQPPTQSQAYVVACVRRLRKHLATLDRAHETFGDYARRVLPSVQAPQRKKRADERESDGAPLHAPAPAGDAYARFVDACGFSDFELADAYDTVLDYGLDDLTPPSNRDEPRFAPVPWRALVDALVRSLPRGTVRTGAEVVQLTADGGGSAGDGEGGEAGAAAGGSAAGGAAARGGWTVAWRGTRSGQAGGGAVRARCVVVGGTASTFRALFPRVPVFDEVRAQPFVRVYARVANLPAAQHRALFGAGRGLTVLEGSDLQKAAHVDRDVYLVAYADNARALRVARMTRAQLQEAVRSAFGAPRLRLVGRVVRCWWPEGTHFFAPLNGRFRDRDAFLHRAQRPAPGVFCVGEALSRRQGWCEGALQSANAVMEDLLACLDRPPAGA
jgi:hypothetical protein